MPTNKKKQLILPITMPHNMAIIDYYDNNNKLEISW